MKSIGLKRAGNPLLAGLFAVGALGTLVGAPDTAEASIVIALPEAEMAREADVIVFGTLIDAKTKVSPKGHVYTDAHLQVYQAVRGAKRGDVLVLQVPGGKLPNGMVAHTAGSPFLEPGQMVFAFLRRYGNNVVRPMGMSYGLLNVRMDGKGGFFVSRNTSGLGLVDRAGNEVPAEMYVLKDEPLQSVVRRIHGHLGTEPTEIPPVTLPPDGGFPPAGGALTK